MSSFSIFDIAGSAMNALSLRPNLGDRKDSQFHFLFAQFRARPRAWCGNRNTRQLLKAINTISVEAPYQTCND